MNTKLLYCYKREDGGTTVSPNKPNCEYIEKYRLIAYENKVITLDGITLYKVKDTYSTEGWYEVDDIRTENDIQTIKEKAKAYDILMGVSE